MGYRLSSFKSTDVNPNLAADYILSVFRKIIDQPESYKTFADFWTQSVAYTIHITIFPPESSAPRDRSNGSERFFELLLFSSIVKEQRGSAQGLSLSIFLHLLNEYHDIHNRANPIKRKTHNSSISHLPSPKIGNEMKKSVEFFEMAMNHL